MSNVDLTLRLPLIGIAPPQLAGERAIVARAYLRRNQPVRPAEKHLRRTVPAQLAAQGALDNQVAIEKELLHTGRNISRAALTADNEGGRLRVPVAEERSHAVDSLGECKAKDSAKLQVIEKPHMACTECGADAPAAKDRRCGRCRLLAAIASNRRYTWTADMDAELTRLYRTAKNKPALSAGLAALSQKLRMPRYIIWNRCIKLRLNRVHNQRWSKDDVAQLRELVGKTPIRNIAAIMKRSVSSVKQKLHSLRLGGRVTEGYSQHELGRLFGLSHNTIGRWIAKGWLDLEKGRITHSSVERFIWEHMNEFRFAGCEEWWLKQMLQTSRRKRVA